MVTFSPFELRMNEQFTMEMMVVMTQVENKHERRNRKAFSWIIRKRWREVASRKRSAIISAVSSYIYTLMNGEWSISQVFYSQTSRNMAICLLGSQRFFCGAQTQNTWLIKRAGSTVNKITTAKRSRFCSSGLIRMMVRRIERRESLSSGLEISIITIQSPPTRLRSRTEQRLRWNRRRKWMDLSRVQLPCMSYSSLHFATHLC